MKCGMKGEGVNIGPGRPVVNKSLECVGLGRFLKVVVLLLWECGVMEKVGGVR